MIVKVQYQETILRQGQVEIDDQEFLEYVNGRLAEGDCPGIEVALDEHAEMLQDFLEDGNPHDWQVANDPSGMGYDHSLLEAYP